MERGLGAPLSPNEETTLRRVHAATKLPDLNRRHIARLVSLDLVSLDEGAVTLNWIVSKRSISRRTCCSRRER